MTSGMRDWLTEIGHLVAAAQDHRDEVQWTPSYWSTALH